ncbi:MAG: hypothetical protein IPK00_19410 [Deltaproteobacteria bacterium]|nr:hypothetical protein [Deltaproteobacteria bacterium]
MISFNQVLLAFTVLGAAVLLGLTLAFGVLLPRSVEAHEEEGPLRRARRTLRRWAVSPLASLVAIFAIAFACGLSNGILRMPVPSVNDEFAYLLGAETFAQGQLANPRHPMWRHFETFSVSSDPVYVSKYPPAASAFLAVGQAFFGHPWYGQLLAYALACVAFAWMARAWLGPRWALVGGVLVALHPVMQHFEEYDYNWSNYSWSHSYWGGAVTMLGASLLFGGVRRFVRDQRPLDATWMAVGIVVLACSRPFEGAIAVVAVAAVLLGSLVRQRIGFGRVFVRLGLPMLAIGVPALLFMLQYNESTTGNPWRLAHQHYADQYGAAAELLILDPKDPPASYPNREMGRFYHEWVRPAFLAQKSSWGHYWNFKGEAVGRFAWFYLSFAAPALIGTFAIVRKRWWRLAAALSLVSFGLVFVTFEFHPHYAATAAPLIHLLLVAGLARLWAVHGRFWIHARLIAILVILAGSITRLFMLPVRSEVIEPSDWPKARAQIELELEALPGDDLVLVRYRPDHSVFREWVKNGADLDGAPVVWARDLGDEASRTALLDYYAGRRIWVLLPDEMPPVITPLKLDRAERSSLSDGTRADASSSAEAHASLSSAR